MNAMRYQRGAGLRPAMGLGRSETCPTALQLTRRQFFGKTALGLGVPALATLLRETASGATPGLASLPHFAPKAKRVVYLFQNGAPTHVDLFDYKPELRRRHGQP